MAEIVVKDILEAGVHYGHRSSRWNPKMRPYIYGRRNQIHIIDIKETIRGLIRAKKYLLKVAAQGGLILFVGTKLCLLAFKLISAVIHERHEGIS